MVVRTIPEAEAKRRGLIQLTHWLDLPSELNRIMYLVKRDPERTVVIVEKHFNGQPKYSLWVDQVTKEGGNHG